MKNKRFLSMVLCFVLVASLFTGFVSTASADDVITHTVTKNQNLIKICKAYGLDYYQCKNAIMILNGYTSELNLNRLTVGQQIKLPATNAIAATVTGSSTTTTTTSTTTTVNGVSTTTTSSSTVNGVNTSYSVSYYLIPHVVKTGETLAGICTTYGTTYAQYASVILAANGLKSANYVWAGKTVYIPSSKAPSSGSCYAVVAHTVSSGETLTSICSAYGTSYASNSQLINGINTGKNLNTIYAGQTLYVPVVATVSNTAATATATTQATASSAATGYYIDFDNSEKGSPYALVGENIVNRAELGTVVTIIPCPNTGYAQQSVSVYRSDNLADITVTNNTFVMPACDVTIEVKYQLGYSISRTPAQNGSFQTLVNGVCADYAVVNDKVTLSFAPYSGYTCVKATYTPADGTPVSISQGEDGTWSFIMPDSEVTIKVEFGRSKMYSLNYEVNDVSAEKISNPAASISFSAAGTTCTKAAKNTQVTVNVSLKENYAIAAFYVNTESGKTLSYTKIDDTHFVFKMPEEKVIVSLAVDYTKSYALTTNGNSGGKLVFTNSSGSVITSAKPGEEVHVLAIANGCYVFQEGTILVTYSGNSAKIETSAVTSNEVKFTMKSADVNAIAAWTLDETKGKCEIKMVTCENGNYQFWIKPIASNPSSTITPDNYAAIGDLVQVRVSGVNSNIICSRIVAYQENSKTPVFDSATATEVTDSSVDFGVQRSGQNHDSIVSASFKMPGGENICVEAYFVEPGYYVNIKNYSNAVYGQVIANVGGAGVTAARLGSTLDIVVAPNTGYTIARLLLKRGATGEQFEITVSDNVAHYTVGTADYTETGDNSIEIIPVWDGGNAFTLSNYGSDYTINGTTTDRIDIDKGATVTLTAATGRTFTGATIYYGSESDGSKTDVGYSYSSGNTVITFTMPGGDVYLNAQTVGQTCTTTYTVPSDVTSYTVNGSPCSGTSMNELLTDVYINVTVDNGKTASAKYKYNGTETTCTWVGTVPADETHSTFQFVFNVGGDGGEVEVSVS